MDQRTAAARRDEDTVHARRAAAGDAEAFRALVLRYQAPLLAVVRNLLPGEADCEDVAQDAFVAAWTHLATYDPARGAFFTWLVRIARNRALNVLTKSAPESMADVPDRAAPEPADDGLTREEAHRRLDAALAVLPTAQRTVFALSEIHGLPLADVAEIEDVPLGTVKSRIARVPIGTLLTGQVSGIAHHFAGQKSQDETARLLSLAVGSTSLQTAVPVCPSGRS